ncbi:NAD(P)-dependent oxidoreductase [Gryllotalpicola reticulitermitis]|uniref:NAD(P)-dependent oxidoreductase n=1 Tax=Gryllotalpicola reticulitermitis TaxID=1184153 RepID=A0ABV8Q8T9_9MICO
MTSIAIIGGTGYSGSNIAAEAVKRGIQVTAVARHEPEHPIDGVTYVTDDIADRAFTDKLAADHDVVIVAIHAVDGDNNPVLPALVPGLAEGAVAGDARLAFVGGAGSTFEGVGGPRLVDSPDFVEAYKPEAVAHAGVLDWLRSDETPAGLQWFYVSPAETYGGYNPGTPIGSYRTSADTVLRDSDGKSEISGADYALAFVDEIVTPTHINQRFVVGY